MATRQTQKILQAIDSKAISIFPLPMISAEQNLELEQKYLNSQRKVKRGMKGGITDSTPRLPNPEKVKKPKRKVAVLMSYCGTGYQGMQINPNVPSIELDLHKALAASGAVSEDNAMDAAKCSFIRCARTDKGVHAAGQVVSLKMILEDDIIERINLYLPKQIRVWGYVRVNNSFHAKNQCDSRIYEYLLPTYCLQYVDAVRYPNSVVAQEAGVEPRVLAHEPVELAKSTLQGIFN
jgi:tRNA pseudouridine38-40 synthase